MVVADFEKVDIAAKDKSDGAVLLMMVDTVSEEDYQQHRPITLMQTLLKILNYKAVAGSKKFKETHGDSKVRFKYVCTQSPPKEIKALLDEYGVEIDVRH